LKKAKDQEPLQIFGWIRKNEDSMTGSRNRKLRWGLLGTARINDRFIPALRNSKFCELSAVASRTAERADEFARKWKIPKTYASYEDLLADPQIDVVYNSLPNHLHAEWTIKAAQAGKHILCEKPFALSTADALSMALAAEQAGVYLTEALVYRHFEQTRKVMEMIRDGDIGEVLVARGMFTFSLNRPEDFRWKPEFGGGSLWDVGCYPVSFLNLIGGGAPQTVFAMQRSAASGVDETLVGQMQYSGDILAQFEGSFNLPRNVGLEIQGTRGLLEVTSPFGIAEHNLVILKKDDKEKQFSFKIDNRFQNQVDDFTSSIIDKKPPLVSPVESCQIVATLAGLQESARSGMPVRIDAPTGDLFKPEAL
jgi:D-xylose 1-dehydrogenase (NADP+, D-xylono-1,5-lactone-forming)